MKPNDEEFEKCVRSTLDSGIANLDAETRSRLAVIRHAALAQKPFLLRWISFDNWGPAAALAMSVIFALVIFINPSFNKSADQLALQDSDIVLELLLNEEAQDESSDPDFYVWLDAVMLEEEDAANAS
ncbi:MAG: hypothetical protein Q7U94_03660 [Sideroxyarcus sp.]|nr:hypothetical protein [Sideroxyarcus sp.]